MVPDYLHASKYGSYLDALVQFGVITGIDPRLLGAKEFAARDLGISWAQADALQRVAALQLGFSEVPEPAALGMVAFGLVLLAATRRAAVRRRSVTAI